MLLASPTGASADCSCIFQGQKLPANLLTNYPTSDPGKYATYSAVSIYGTTCGAWDQMEGTPWKSSCPNTADFSAKEKSWCQLPWCYVDASCSSKISSSVFSGSSTAYYSYDACGAPDCYNAGPSGAYGQGTTGCPYDPYGTSTYKVHKGGDCACMFQGSQLPASIYTNYPSTDAGKYKDLAGIANYGVTCAAWDQVPDTPWASSCPLGADWCDQSNNWCQIPWCYVSSSCSTKIASSVFSGSNAAYYSYDTCMHAPDCYTNAAKAAYYSYLPPACPFDSSDTQWYTAKLCTSGWTPAGDSEASSASSTAMTPIIMVLVTFLLT